jgi:hypothetical protein
VAIVQAFRAAEVNAYEKLAERVMGVRIDSRTTVQDMALESDRIRTALAASLKGVDFTEYSIGPKRCRATGELVIESVIKRIERTYRKQVEKRTWGRDRIKEDDLEKVTTRIERNTFRETGDGVRTDGGMAAPAGDEPLATERRVVEEVVKKKIVVE